MIQNILRCPRCLVAFQAAPSVASRSYTPFCTLKDACSASIFFLCLVSIDSSPSWKLMCFTAVCARTFMKSWRRKQLRQGLPDDGLVSPGKASTRRDERRSYVRNLLHNPRNTTTTGEHGTKHGRIWKPSNIENALNLFVRRMLQAEPLMDTDSTDSNNEAPMHTLGNFHVAGTWPASTKSGAIEMMVPSVSIVMRTAQCQVPRSSVLAIR